MSLGLLKIGKPFETARTYTLNFSFLLLNSVTVPELLRASFPLDPDSVPLGP
jgi:hypothetical protein